MAQKPENVFNLLEDLLSYSIPVAKQEADEFQEMLSKDHEGATLEAWDMYYYAEKYVKKNITSMQNRLVLILKSTTCVKAVSTC